MMVVMDGDNLDDDDDDDDDANDGCERMCSVLQQNFLQIGALFGHENYSKMPQFTRTSSLSSEMRQLSPNLKLSITH